MSRKSRKTISPKRSFPYPIFNNLIETYMIKNLLTQIEPTYWYCMGGVILFFTAVLVYSFYMAHKQRRNSL